MNPLDPEALLDQVNQAQWLRAENDSASVPITSLIITVDEDLQFRMVVSSADTSGIGHIEYPPGTVRSLDDELLFTSSTNTKIRVRGYQRSDKTLTDQCVETYCIENVESAPPHEQSVAYTVEWIQNVEDICHLWPDAVRYKGSNLTLGKSNNPFEITIPDVDFGNGLSSACMELYLEGITCYLFQHRIKKRHKVNDPAFLLYKGNVGRSLREKILTALSFIVGRQLIYLGHCDLDLTWNILGFCFQSSKVPTKQALSYVTQQPVDIYKHHRFMDGDLISKLVSNIIEKYDELCFDKIMWRYWFAEYAPIHARAVQIGAIIEAVQRIFLELNESKLRCTVIEKKLFKKQVMPALIKVIGNLSLNEEEKSELIGNLYGLNRLSQKKISESFFSYLGLNLSSLELTAWQRRHDAAHGNFYEYHQAIDVIRETKILINIFRRQIIKIFDLGGSYIDYYSINHPTRPIHQGCENDT